MARVTEKKFAAFSVRVWRLVQRLEKLKAKEKAAGIIPGSKLFAEYNAAHKKLIAATNALILNY